MTLKSFFQNFESQADPNAEPPPRPGAMHAAVSISQDGGYDAGYASGWDDAVRASDERGERISAELERTVQDLGFSYHEALDQLRGQFLEALTGFLDTLMPDVIPQVFRAQLDALLAAQTGEPPEVEVVVSPDQLALFQRLLSDEVTASVSLVAEDTVARDQAYIRIAQRETLIDVGPLVTEFKTQIAAFGQANEEVRHAG